jgi:putative addiction module CopG family antidote
MVTIAKLPPQTEAEILDLIESGGYHDATEIVVQAVHHFAQREQALADLRAKIQIGIDQADRGEFIDDSPEFRRKLREEAHELAISGLPLDPDVCG